MHSSPRTYCIIGDPIDHSLSPAMQNAAFSALGLNCTYIAFKVTAQELEQSVESLRSIKVAGFNVTIPHKVQVMKFLDELDHSAEKAAAVNTVNNIEGILKGYNTDIHGFIEPLRRRKVDFQGMHVLLLGAGGAARAIVAALSEQIGIAKVIIANRDPNRAKELADIGSELGLDCGTVSLDQASRISPDSDLIVNSTSMGMKNEPSIIDHTHIKKGSIIYDIVYRPITTDLIENAKYAQAVVVHGYEMLIEQGARAFELWTGIPAPRDVMKKSLLGVFGEPT
ncbi:MAG TPA: shikimate dehydrogenase [Nitrososphaera sp.]|nr:shikimate dehydrogenase [Nitrososphaera sp.]